MKLPFGWCLRKIFREPRYIEITRFIPPFCNNAIKADPV